MDAICRADMFERQHRKPRFALFTPMKASRGPNTAAAVCQWRVTVGELANGQEFLRIANWKAAAEPHEMMGQPWAGISYFVESLAAPRLFTPTQLPALGAAARSCAQLASSRSEHKCLTAM